MKTFLIKLSGEAMAGDMGFGLDFKYIEDVCRRIKKIHDMGYGIGIVCGGGNFMRGRDATVMDRETADYTGMLATIMNSLVLKDTFTRLGCDVYNQSGLSVAMIDDIDSIKSSEAIENGKIVIFGGGIGKPFFSTDTGAAMRAVDINADMIIKLTNVDGVYNKDPRKYSDAIKFDSVSFDVAIDNKLGIMDLEAMEMCKKNDIKICVMDINDDMCLDKLISGEKIGTMVL